MCARSMELLDVAKDILDYMITKQIAITAEYVPSALNYQSDPLSINHLRDPSCWKYDSNIFSQILNI